MINLGEINIKSHNEIKRIYPYKNILSHVVGYVDIDQRDKVELKDILKMNFQKSKIYLLVLTLIYSS